MSGNTENLEDKWQQETLLHTMIQFSSVAQSCPTMWPHGLQHARPPCPSPTPRVYSTSCPLSWSCHPTVSCSAVPFSSCPQSFPASGSFPMSQLFASGGQSIGVSAATQWSLFTEKNFLLAISHILQGLNSPTKDRTCVLGRSAAL